MDLITFALVGHAGAPQVHRVILGLEQLLETAAKWIKA